jgi:hypothetical protein
MDIRSVRDISLMFRCKTHLMSLAPELIRKIEGHQGFVKGVCWDPVGQYLATQVDKIGCSERLKGRLCQPVPIERRQNGQDMEYGGLVVRGDRIETL